METQGNQVGTQIQSFKELEVNEEKLLSSIETSYNFITLTWEHNDKVLHSSNFRKSPLSLVFQIEINPSRGHILTYNQKQYI